MPLLKPSSLAATLLATTSIINTPLASAEDKMDEIIVERQYLQSNEILALKSPTPIIDVPQSLSIIDAAQITEQGFDSVADIINYTAGVINSQGEGHRDAVVFRGVRSTADFYVDSVRDDVQYYRGFYNIDQLEVLRGANALLFGRGGTGGLINRVTKKGQIGEEFTGYKSYIDSFGAHGVEIDRNFDSGDNHAIRLNAMYEGLANHRDHYDGERLAINPTARIAVGENSTIDLSYEYINNDRFIDRGIPTGDNGQPVEAFKDIIFGDPALNTAEVDAHILRATLTQDFSENLKGVFNVTYSDFDKLYQNLYASGYDQAATPNEVTLDGYVDTTQRQSFNLSGNLISEFKTGSIGHTIVTGVEYRDTQNDNDRFNTDFDPTAGDEDNITLTVGNPLTIIGGQGVDATGAAFANDFTSDQQDGSEAKIKVFSAYIQDEIALSDNFDLVLGGRFDSFDIVSTNLLTGGVNSRKDEEFTPRLGLVYKPQENISVYGSYSESFLPRSGGQFASVSGSTELLEPDYFETLEAGIKWDFNSGLSLTAAVFQNEQKIDASPDGAPENLERRGLEVEGFELQLEGNLTDQLYVTAGYTNLSGKTDFTQTGIAQELPRELPENTFSIWSTYQMNDKLGFGLGATYQDDSFITDLDIGSDTSTHPTLPSFTRVDAAAYYDLNDDLRLQLNVENLTDELYFPTSHSTHQATVGAPLNAKFTVSGKF